MFKMNDNFLTKIFYYNFNHNKNNNIILFKIFNFLYFCKKFDLNYIDYYFIIKFNNKLYPLNNKELFNIINDEFKKILL